VAGPSARRDGFLPIRDYAAIGDGRTVGLVGRDGGIDWLCLPDLDSRSVFAALVDAGRGGRFDLAPAVPYDAARHYLPATNVLQTTFTTARGVVRITDALTVPNETLTPYRELARRVEGLAGAVPMRWCVEPRFDYARRGASFTDRGGVAVAAYGPDAVAVLGWDVGDIRVDRPRVAGEFTARAGASSVLALSVAHQEPLVFPPRVDVEARIARTASRWRAWAADCAYDGPWSAAVTRSALALKLLIFAPSGAMAAAASTSLPEEIGGSRNWDYRFSWPRDSAFALQALTALGYRREAQAFFSWLLHSSQLTHPRLQVLYRLNGRADAVERDIGLDGYRGSKPVRIGNGAASQRQLDVYGEVLDAAARAAQAGHRLDRDHAHRIAAITDHICAVWRAPDAGMWEVRTTPSHFTQSKMMCAIALARAAQMADGGLIPAAAVRRWTAEEQRVRAFVETRCWSERKQSYVRAATDETLDAALLLAVALGYAPARSPRLVGTVDAVRRELADGPLVRRYLADDGLPGGEGAFVACSFWLVEALARQGRTEEAAALMDGMLGCANDVGLYAEEIDPATGDFLGNFPQALSHLSLINAARAIACAQR
jgi:GH15 family glucan-1,4-alpha-glucosidase